MIPLHHLHLQQYVLRRSLSLELHFSSSWCLGRNGSRGENISPASAASSAETGPIMEYISPAPDRTSWFGGVRVSRAGCGHR